MATVKMSYIVQSCPQCHKKLLKVAAGTVLIGSPLITCKHCGKTYRTDLRQEWDFYPHKHLLWVLPLVIIAVFGVTAAVMQLEAALTLIAMVFGLLLGFGFTIKDLIRMLKSKKRMKDPAYLDQLLLYGLLTPEQYVTYKQKAAGSM